MCARVDHSQIDYEPESFAGAVVADNSYFVFMLEDYNQLLDELVEIIKGAE